MLIGHSKICQNLKKDNITDYSLTTLKNYLNQNFNSLEIDCTPYYEALILYEKANALEDMVDEKIELEIFLFVLAYLAFCL